MRKIKVGMLGIGNIGKGTYRTLEMGRKKIEDTTGLSIEIVKILNRHPDRDRGIDIPREKYVTDAYDIGCELMRKRVECAIMIKAAQADYENSFEEYEENLSNEE